MPHRPYPASDRRWRVPDMIPLHGMRQSRASHPDAIHRCRPEERAGGVTVECGDHARFGMVRRPRIWRPRAPIVVQNTHVHMDGRSNDRATAAGRR
jgi:hypothetical protein